MPSITALKYRQLVIHYCLDTLAICYNGPF